jgi:hypothetical protein
MCWQGEGGWGTAGGREESGMSLKDKLSLSSCTKQPKNLSQNTIIQMLINKIYSKSQVE